MKYIGKLYDIKTISSRLKQIRDTWNLDLLLFLYENQEKEITLKREEEVYYVENICIPRICFEWINSFQEKKDRKLDELYNLHYEYFSKNSDLLSNYTKEMKVAFSRGLITGINVCKNRRKINWEAYNQLKELDCDFMWNFSGDKVKSV